MPAKPSGPAKVMDVTHPKNVQPGATSRPVIVASRPMIAADPMIAQSAADVLMKTAPEKVADTEKVTLEHKPELVINREAKTIDPEPTVPAADAAANEQSEAPGEVLTSAPLVDPVIIKQTASPSATITESTETKSRVEPETPAPASSQPEFIAAEPETDEQADEEVPTEKTAEQKQADDIEALIASRKYAVPIGKIAKRRARIALLIVSTILLVLIVLDLLLDMGILHASGIPHTTFFTTI